MNFTAAEILAWTQSLIWPLVRISAMLLVAPVFGARSVNVRVRVTLGFLLAIMVAPFVRAQTQVDPLSMDGLMVAVHQVLIGVAMGFILSMVFSALTQAGESIAMSMGLGFASAMDPAAGVQVPMVSQYYSVLATLIFLALNGHLVLLELLLRSFETLPITAGGLSPDDFWRVASFGSTMFAGAVLVALPAVASLLLINLAMGIITRAAQQLNIFAVGFPITLLGGFIIITLTVSRLPARVGELMMQGFALVQQLLGF